MPVDPDPRPPLRRRRLHRLGFLLLLGLLLIGLAAPAAVWAKKQSASGGYARPSAGLSRTPSTRAAAPARRTPSTSQGYSRPPTSGAAAAAATALALLGGSASDQALARGASRQALDQFRAGQVPADSAPRRPSTAPGVGSSARRPSYQSHASVRLDDLDDLAELGVALVQLWNAGTADRAPATVAAPARVAPEAPVSPAADPPSSDDGWPWGTLLLTLLLLTGGFLLYRRWRRKRPAAARAAGSPPRWFRLGLTLPVDPALFVLAAPHAAVAAPAAATGSGLLSVERLGRAVSGATTWYRLYVSGAGGGDAFFQVHLNAGGQPDEYRYFSQLDVVAPADAAEWAFWLDASDGMIGWPEFQTRDGQSYQRRWSPGDTRIAPRRIDETLRTLDGETRHRQQAMLYARPTGAAAPAPAVEYLLVAAVEQDDAAWVSLQVGIDLPVGALQLS